MAATPSGSDALTRSKRLRQTLELLGRLGPLDAESLLVLLAAWDEGWRGKRAKGVLYDALNRAVALGLATRVPLPERNFHVFAPSAAALDALAQPALLGRRPDDLAAWFWALPAHNFLVQRVKAALFFARLAPKAGAPRIARIAWMHAVELAVPEDENLRPDGLALLELESAASAALFVEIDRGSEPLRTWRSKARRYVAWSQAGVALRFGAVQLPVAATRLLVLTEGARRREHLVELLAKQGIHGAHAAVGFLEDAGVERLWEAPLTVVDGTAARLAVLLSFEASAAAAPTAKTPSP